MSDTDFDTAVENSWQVFQTRLATRLSMMERDDTSFITPMRALYDDGWFALRISHARGLRCTVASSCAGDAEFLTHLGWRRLRDGRFICHETPGRSGAIADLVVRTVRELWSVPDPSFLAELGCPRPDWAPVLSTGELGPTGLLNLVREELETYAGGSLPIRSDATILLPTTQVESSIGISHDEPRIDIVGQVADNAHRRFDGAALTDLAEKRPDIELIRHGNDLYAVRSIDARTFFRGDLFQAVYEWFDFIDHDLPAALPPVRKPGPVAPRSRGPKLVNRVPSLQLRSEIADWPVTSHPPTEGKR
ncbi:hypothetical protein C5O27_18820 [Gordonia alkanivorans]|uniref:TY-Chap domain-containing protein n=1 Tax=Gordonia alkanivorans TaxID=84096 RepID=UPI000FDD2D14|nr:hypothetical protein [Gordonia alkanivorans]AZZ82857.1 hypothetical protein C5O27_18820 [Gordonia alkanivorans]